MDTNYPHLTGVSSAPDLFYIILFNVHNNNVIGSLLHNVVVAAKLSLVT